jgi:hypothetical protein
MPACHPTTNSTTMLDVSPIHHLYHNIRRIAHPPTPPQCWMCHPSTTSTTKPDATYLLTQPPGSSTTTTISTMMLYASPTNQLRESRWEWRGSSRQVSAFALAHPLLFYFYVLCTMYLMCETRHIPTVGHVPMQRTHNPYPDPLNTQPACMGTGFGRYKYG